MMVKTLKEALQQIRLVSDNIEYAIVHLHPRAITAAASIIAEVGDPFCALIVDKDEVTLIIPAQLLDEFGTRLSAETIHPQRYRLITLDVELDMGIIGLMARLSTALADAGVSILTYAAYSRDHLLVPSTQFDIAITALERLKSG